MANYVAKLPNGRYFAIELPEGSTETDTVTGQLILLPPAIHLLDRLRVLLCPLPEKSTPSRIKTLRETLGLSPSELADQIQIDAAVVCAWEAGKSKPNSEELATLERLRQQAIQRGILLPERKTAS
jgi:DNA-binding XRE family transcriptional regulator